MKKLLFLTLLATNLIFCQGKPNPFPRGVDVKLVQLDTLTTTDRDNLTIPGNKSMVIYNSTVDSVQYYDLSALAWRSVGYGAGGGVGDMTKAVYDPTNVNGDVFDMTNMFEGTTNKIFTATERTKLAGIESGATADQNLNEVPFNPYLTISSTNGQAAFEELKDELDAAVLDVASLKLYESFTATGGETSWVLTNTPSSGYLEQVYIGGILQADGVGYTISGNTVSFIGVNNPLVSGDFVEIYYNDISAPTPAWGSITGTLSNQTDLQTALDAKADDNLVAHLAGAETFTGDKTLADLTLLNIGSLPLSTISSNSTNSIWNLLSGDLVIQGNGVEKWRFGRSTSAFTAAGVVQGSSIVASSGTSTDILKADGSFLDETTLATTTDLSNYVDLSTNQSVGGNKTFGGTTRVGNGYNRALEIKGGSTTQAVSFLDEFNTLNGYLGVFTGNLEFQDNLGASILNLNFGTKNVTFGNDVSVNNNLAVTGSATATDFNGVALTTGGVATQYLDATGNYSTPAGGGGSPLTTKGDLYTYSTTDDRLPVGTDGLVLKANSANATGLEWGNPTQIEITNGNANASQPIVFTSSTSSNQALQVDGGFNINPFTNEVTLSGQITANSVKAGALASTGVAVTLDNALGTYYNMSAANSGTTYTTSSLAIGGYAKCLINTTSEPTVTGGTKVAGATWVTGTDMYLVIYTDDGTNVKYFFLEI